MKKLIIVDKNTVIPSCIKYKKLSCNLEVMSFAFGFFSTSYVMSKYLPSIFRVKNRDFSRMVVHQTPKNLCPASPKQSFLPPAFASQSPFISAIRSRLQKNPSTFRTLIVIKQKLEENLRARIPHRALGRSSLGQNKVSRLPDTRVNARVPIDTLRNTQYRFHPIKMTARTVALVVLLLVACCSATRILECGSGNYHHPRYYDKSYWFLFDL